MKHLRHSHTMRRIFYLGMIVFVLVPLAGCEEANLAIDSILGRRSPVLSAAPQTSSQSLVPALKTSTRRQNSAVVEPSAPREQKPAGEPAKTESHRIRPSKEKDVPRANSPPDATGRTAREKSAGELFQAERNPFKPPTEVLPQRVPAIHAVVQIRPLTA